MHYGSFILLALLAIIAIAIKAIKPFKKGKKYTAIGFLLTPAELKFYKVLKASVKENETVFAKVRQADIIKPDCKKSSPDFWQHFNLIAKRHVDFVICDTNTIRPLTVVELNDSSHRQNDRQRRDEDLRNALKETGINLVEIPTATFYSIHELQSAIYGTGSRDASKPQASKQAQIHVQPACVTSPPKSNGKYAPADKDTCEQPKKEQSKSGLSHPDAKWMPPD